jgi:hypothetical protein
MNGGCWGLAWLLAMGCAIPALAQDSEQSRYYIQQMIELAADNDETGVTAMQRMLEQNPRPASQNATASRAALQRGQAVLQANDLNAALTPAASMPSTIWDWSSASSAASRMPSAISSGRWPWSLPGRAPGFSSLKSTR